LRPHLLVGLARDLTEPAGLVTTLLAIGSTEFPKPAALPVCVPRPEALKLMMNSRVMTRIQLRNRRISPQRSQSRQSMEEEKSLLNSISLCGLCDLCGEILRFVGPPWNPSRAIRKWRGKDSNLQTPGFEVNLILTLNLRHTPRRECFVTWRGPNRTRSSGSPRPRCTGRLRSRWPLLGPS
jgi:hypothetical protein